MATKKMSRKQWQLICADFVNSGHSMQEYGDRNDISFKRLRYWYRKLKPAIPKEQEQQFVALKVLPPQENICRENDVKITLLNGISIEVKALDIIGLVKGLANVL